MFENIGGKIKMVAKISCWIGIVLSFIVGIVLSNQNAPLGILCMMLGALGSWVGSFLSYGFGELIEQVTEIAQNTYYTNIPVENTDVLLATEVPKGRRFSETLRNVRASEQTTPTAGWTCKKCGAHNLKNASSCKSCGNYK